VLSSAAGEPRSHGPPAVRSVERLPPVVAGEAELLLQPKTIQVNHRLTPLLVGLVASFLTAQAPQPAPLTTNGPNRCKASQLIGLAITNSKNENLGEIQEIVLDQHTKHIAYAVVGFGGFLGMSEKYFAMPWRLIEVSQRGADTKPRALLGLDRETLKAAPGFDKNSWPDMANAAWAQQVDDYYRLRNEAAPPTGAAEPKGSAPDGTRGVDRVPGSEAFTHRRLSRLIGMNVVDQQQAKLADVEDFVVDTTLAAVDGVLLSFGGTLGLGEYLALLPVSAIKLDLQKDVFVLPCTRADLDAMVLKDGKMPALNGDTWLTKGREQCAKAAKGVEDLAAGAGDVVPRDASGVGSVQYADSYDVKKVETIKGTITTVGSVRIGDAKEERVRWRVRVADGREVVVYVAPATFADLQSLGLRANSAVEITGSPAKYGNQSVLVAGTIKADGKTAVLRDAQGHVVWTKK
jgi:sporulation protein YlmC with PRC-barrel domain